MSRSIWKGPFVEESLIKKVENKKTTKIVIKCFIYLILLTLIDIFLPTTFRT